MSMTAWGAFPAIGAEFVLNDIFCSMTHAIDPNEVNSHHLGTSLSESSTVLKTIRVASFHLELESSNNQGRDESQCSKYLDLMISVGS